MQLHAAEMSNTTIVIVATDAALTKTQCHRLATTAHDGMARAIVPAHTPLDGDLVFAVATGKRAPVSVDQFQNIANAAATCLARAIARGVYAATPAEKDLLLTYQAMNNL